MPESPSRPKEQRDSDQRPLYKDWTFWIVMVGVVVLVLVGILVGIAWQPHTDLSLEAGKFILQAIFIVAVGGLIGLLVDHIRQRAESRATTERKARDNEEREREYRTRALEQTIVRLDASYESVKRLRRCLRLETGTDLTGKIKKKTYLSEALKLNDEQMKLEGLNKDIEAAQDRVPELGEAAKQVKAMEKYLGKIWKETENEYPEADEAIVAKDHDRLGAFLAPSECDDPVPDFKEVFSKHYHGARGLLIKASAEVRLSRSR